MQFPCARVPLRWRPVPPPTAESTPSAPPAASPGRIRVLGTLLAVAVVAAWAGSLAGPFVFDDLPSILENESIRRLRPLGAVLFPDQAGGLTTSGRPLLNLSFALNYAVGGTAVGGYHAVNLAIHVAATLLLFGFVRRTLESAPLRARFGTRAAGLAAAVAGDTVRAAAILEEGLAVYPHAVPLHNNLAVVHERRGSYELAARTIEHALLEDANCPHLHKNLGDYLYRAQRYDEAFDAFVRVVRLAPLHGPDVHLKLGNIHYRRGALEQARQSWEQALALDPGNRIVMANLSALPQPAPESEAGPHDADAAVESPAADDDALAAFGADA